MFFTYKG